jgi:hypothetical protein
MSFNIVIVEKSSSLKETSIKELNEDELYKKAGLKNATNFKLVHTFNISNLTGINNTINEILIYGKTSGKAGQENKYEFPPPIDNVLFFGNCILLKTANKKLESLSVEEWNLIYNKLYGGFENLKDSELNDEIEEAISEQLELQKIQLENKNAIFTKEGYLVDDFIVDDNAVLNNHETSKIKSSKKNKKSSKLQNKPLETIEISPSVIDNFNRDVTSSSIQLFSHSTTTSLPEKTEPKTVEKTTLKRSKKKILEQPLDQADDQQPVSQPFDQQPVSQPFDQQPVSQPFDQQPVSQPFDQQPVSQPFDQPLSKIKKLRRVRKQQTDLDITTEPLKENTTPVEPKLNSRRKKKSIITMETSDSITESNISTLNENLTVDENINAIPEKKHKNQKKNNAVLQTTEENKPENILSSVDENISIPNLLKSQRKKNPAALDKYLLTHSTQLNDVPETIDTEPPKTSIKKQKKTKKNNISNTLDENQTNVSELSININGVDSSLMQSSYLDCENELTEDKYL